MSKAATVTQNREVTVIVRYVIKQDAYVKELNTHVKAGTVILYVENDKGARYYVILRRNGKHSCSCPHIPSKKSATCYHITHCRNVENERAAKVAAQRKAEQEIEEIVAQVEQELAQERAAAPATATAGDLGARGSLSSNRGFSLTR